MDMKEAFISLLNGNKITRPEWDTNEHIEYIADTNTFMVGCSDIDKLYKVNNVEFINDNNIELINFNYEINHLCAGLCSATITLKNDDKNEIWISPQERQELIEANAMRWELTILCYRYREAGKCRYRSCKLYSEYVPCEVHSYKKLEEMSTKEVKRLYNRIKEEEE